MIDTERDTATALEAARVSTIIIDAAGPRLQTDTYATPTQQRLVVVAVVAIDVQDVGQRQPTACRGILNPSQPPASPNRTSL